MPNDTRQITFLLFLEMAHERTQPPWSQPAIVPEGLDWVSLPTVSTGRGPAARWRRASESAEDE